MVEDEDPGYPAKEQHGKDDGKSEAENEEMKK
jgi:hypothetical protein